MALVLKKLFVFKRIALHFSGRLTSTKPSAGNDYKCKLLIVGGGAGGCSVAWRFSRRLQKNEICVLDGAQYHYYQPVFPLVASGIRPLEASRRLMSAVLPPSVCFIKDYALEFEPKECYVQTMGGSRIYYDFLVVAVGVVNDYEKIPGLKTALDDPCLPVTTVYSEIYCTKTWDILRKTRGGHAIFTFPGTDTKCPGAAQKIMYLADDYFRKRKTRSLLNFTYNTGAPHIFNIPKYATALARVASERHLVVNLCWELVEVTSRHAVFLDPDGATLALPYNLLHATPPMRAPVGLRRSPLAAPSGLLDVDRLTLQHARFPNVYGLGDCVNTPNTKTAASAGTHYYQPLWTLVGGGITSLAQTRRPAASVLPPAAKWLRERAASIDPADQHVVTENGDKISYEYIVVAVGIQNDYCKIPGLAEALAQKDSGVSTIYSSEYCEKTWADLQNFKGGEAIFTFPDSPIKCPGAPQKIVYLAESYFAQTKVRSKANISYNTCLPVIFGVKKYADELLKVAARKKINVNYKTVLKEVWPDKREALFVNHENGEKSTIPYNLLHVTPPMRTPDFLRNSPLVDATGYLDVDKFTLQHKQHPNVYGIGDCTNTPNSKTAAAIAKQCYVLEQNLLATMARDNPKEKYNGYGACPLVTSYNTCILAEFLYDGVPHETMPFNQAKESRIAFYMKRDLFPFIYWNLMLKGHYHGPELVRRIVNPFGF